MTMTCQSLHLFIVNLLFECYCLTIYMRKFINVAILCCFSNGKNWLLFQERRHMCDQHHHVTSFRGTNYARSCPFVDLYRSWGHRSFTCSSRRDFMPQEIKKFLKSQQFVLHMYHRLSFTRTRKAKTTRYNSFNTQLYRLVSVTQTVYSQTFSTYSCNRMCTLLQLRKI